MKKSASVLGAVAVVAASALALVGFPEHPLTAVRAREPAVADSPTSL
ncbi:hypothetical protein [Microbacterium alcoholitolerans]